MSLTTPRRVALGSAAAHGLAVLILGVNWPVMKLGLHYVDPFWMASIRLVSACVVAFALNLVTGRSLRVPQGSDRKITILVGLFQFAGMLALAGLAVYFAPAAVAAAALYTTPLWLCLILVVRTRSLPKAPTIAAVILILLGLLGIMWGALSAGAAASTLAGILTGLAGSLCTSISIDSIRRHTWKTGPLDLMPWQLLVAAVPVTLIALVVKGLPPLSVLGWAPAGLLFFTGPLTTGFAMWGLIVASRHLPSLVVGSVSALTPGVGLIAAALLTGEPITMALLVGVVLIIGGAFVQIGAAARK